MASGIVAQSRLTPDRTVYASSNCDRPVSGIQPCISFGPSGIPKASSITRSPQAFHSEDGDFGLLDMFVDSKDFELHETVRSLRFTAAASNISNLFPQTPRSIITLPPSSTGGTYSPDNVYEVETVKSVDDHAECELERVVESAATKLKVNDVTQDDVAPTAAIPKSLTPEALAEARRQLDAFMIEPVTPPSAQQNDVSGVESRRPFSLSPRSRKMFEKVSMRRDRKVPPRQAENVSSKVDEDGATSSGPQPLSKMVSGLERLFSRISSTSRPADPNGDSYPTDKPPFPNSPIAQRKMKARLTKWKGDVKKFLERLAV